MKRKTLETSALALLGLGIGANAVLGPLVLRVLRALTLSEQVGNAGFGKHVGDLKEA